MSDRDYVKAQVRALLGNAEADAERSKNGGELPSERAMRLASQSPEWKRNKAIAEASVPLARDELLAAMRAYFDAKDRFIAACRADTTRTDRRLSDALFAAERAAREAIAKAEGRA